MSNENRSMHIQDFGLQSQFLKEHDFAQWEFLRDLWAQVAILERARFRSQGIPTRPGQMKNKRDFPNRCNQDFQLWRHVFIECTLFRTGFEFYYHLVSGSREGPFPDPGKYFSALWKIAFARILY